MHRHLVVLTGASRGLGAALARRLLADPSTRLLGVSRHADPALDALARERGSALEQWHADLAEAPAVAARLGAWLDAVDPSDLERATLVNNAAALTRIGPIDAVEPGELSAALRVGLEAPLLLARAFLRGTRGWPHVARRVLNVSSGLGRRAMAGQAAYCAVKAGLDHASRALALDEALQPNPARIVSLAPGVIDTDMQRALRAGDPAHFPDHALFVQLKDGGRLTAPDEAAARLLAWLERPDFGAQPVADVREG